jgi:hypothetical protein
VVVRRFRNNGGASLYFAYRYPLTAYREAAALRQKISETEIGSR